MAEQRQLGGLVQVLKVPAGWRKREKDASRPLIFTRANSDPPGRHSLGSHPEVLLDEVEGHSERHQGGHEDRCDGGDDADGRQHQQRRPGQRLQGGRDVLRERAVGVETSEQGSTFFLLLFYCTTTLSSI